MMSNLNKILLFSYEKGYRVVDGKAINPKGKELKLWKNKKGYLSFGIRPNWIEKRTVYRVYIHKLVAFQKFGEKIFETGIKIRHLDDNPINNLDYNIEIGTNHDNQMDIDPEIRLARALKATVKLRKFTDLQIELIRQDSKINKLTYKEIMKKWNISSLGTLSYIINNQYKTKV